MYTRLGRNQGRYHGDPIPIGQIQAKIHRLALAEGWQADTFLALPAFSLYGYRRSLSSSAPNIYVSAGIHGDEPSGPLALVQMLQANNWPKANIWMVPCLNPSGFSLNQRENRDGIDLNRDYRHRHSLEIASHVRWLEQQPPFDVALHLHEDWEANGFYVYELNPYQLPSLADPMVEAARKVCPLETAELVDNFECRGSIIRPEVIPDERPQWAEAIYLIANKVRQTYTIETPSDFPLELRVRTHLAALQIALEVFTRRAAPPHAHG